MNNPLNTPGARYPTAINPSWRNRVAEADAAYDAQRDSISKHWCASHGFDPSTPRTQMTDEQLRHLRLQLGVALASSGR